MGSYRSLVVPMDSNRSEWVLISLYRTYCVLMGPNGSLWVPYVSIWIPVGPYGSLSVFIRPCGF